MRRHPRADRADSAGLPATTRSSIGKGRLSNSAKRLALLVVGGIFAALLVAAPASAAELPLVGTFSELEPGEALAGDISGITVDESTGHVFVADQGHDSIDIFDANGNYLNRIKGTETAEGSFGWTSVERRNSLAVDNSGGPDNGDIYAVARESGNVYAFKPNSSSPSGYEEIWHHSYAGEIPCGIAVDPSGSIWLNRRLREEAVKLNKADGSETAEGIPLGIEACGFSFDSAGALYTVTAGGEEAPIYKYVGGAFDSTFGPSDGEQGAVAASLSPEGKEVYSVTINGGAGAHDTLFGWDHSGNLLSLTPPENGLGERTGVAYDAAAHRVYVADSQQDLVYVYGITREFHLNVNGEGTVECDTGFGAEPCASAYELGATVTLIAEPQEGSAFAGWIGCKQVGTTSCEVTVDSSTEVTAIFLRQGSQGSQGPQGEAGKTGSNGATGAQGPAGPQGVPGLQGPQGKAGPPGKVTCKVKQKGKKVKVTCTVKSAAASSSALRWRLMRQGRAYSHGTATGGRLELNLSHLRPGRYQLHVGGRSGTATTIVIA